MFPFSIRYKTNLNNNFGEDKNKAVFGFIEEFIRERTADQIVIEGDRLYFESAFFQWRMNTNILVPIEKGVFIIEHDGDGVILTYEFFMYRLFTIVAIMSIFMAIVSKEMWVGVICFVWLGGMNWLIAVIRHRMMLTKISKGIDNLMTKLIAGEISNFLKN